MKLETQTGFWERTKEEIIEKVKTILFLFCIMFIGNVAYGILTKNWILATLNALPITLYFAIERSHTKWKTQQTQKKT